MPPPAKSLCPICREQAPDKFYRPFCSKRCADVDLGRWLSGSYAIPGQDGDAQVEADGADTSENDGGRGPRQA